LKNSNFDKTIVAGHLGLGGTHKLGSGNGFVPQVGRHFDLLDWGRVGGSFDASGLPLPAGPQPYGSQLALDGSTSLVAVPGPGT
jgi:hypothetical protein